MLLRRFKAILVSGLVWAVLGIPLSVAAGVLRYNRIPPYDLIAMQRGCVPTLNLTGDSVWVTACGANPPASSVQVSDIDLMSRLPPAFPIILREAAEWTIWAAVVGALFALILLAAERRRTLSDLRAWRFVLWGALAAIALPLSLTILVIITEGLGRITWLNPVIIVLFGTFGAVCAVGMLRLAKRAA